MKKNLLILTMAIIFTAGTALADGMVYDPTEYPTVTQIPISKVSTSKSTSTDQMPSNVSLENKIKENSTLAQDAISSQSGSFNNALFELDSAQVNIRNELLDYQSKYQEIDTQYQLIKEQRKVLADQIKTVERRIKDIEKSKNHIRKTMI